MIFTVGTLESLHRRCAASRRRRGLTISQAAREVGIPRGTYDNLERGRHAPTLPSVIAVLRWLESEPDGG